MAWAHHLAGHPKALATFVHTMDSLLSWRAGSIGIASVLGRAGGLQADASSQSQEQLADVLNFHQSHHLGI